MKEFEEGVSKGLEIYNKMLPFKVFQNLLAIEGVPPVYDIVGAFSSRELAEDFIEYQTTINPESKYEIEVFVESTDRGELSSPLSEKIIFMKKEKITKFSSKRGMQIMKNVIDLSLPEYDYKQIRKLGNSYLNAAKLCDNPRINEIGWIHHLFVPIVTNYTFACELFFKSLLKYENKKAKKHELIELFMMLNDETQKSIMDKDNEEIFLKNLASVSDLFEKWRYIYEYPISHLEYGFLTDLAERLLITIDNIG